VPLPRVTRGAILANGARSHLLDPFLCGHEAFCDRAMARRSCTFYFSTSLHMEDTAVLPGLSALSVSPREVMDL
jgi:hypothetical protein